MSLSDALKGLAHTGWEKQPAAVTAIGGSSEIPLAVIHADPGQPRKKFDNDKLQELADSIREHGLMQPIGLRPHPDKPGHYFITFGERRFRAFNILGFEKIDAIVRDSANVSIEALIENLQRDDLTPWETATALAMVAKTTGKKNTEIAASIGKSNNWVSEYMQVRKMPPAFSEALEAGTVNDISTLNEAFRLYGDYQEEVTKLIVSASPDNPVSRDSVRKLSAKLKSEDARPKGGKAKAPPATTGDDEGNEGAANTTAPAAGTTTLPRIFVADDEGAEIGYLDLAREASAGFTNVIRDAAGLTTRESFTALRITRIVTD